MTGHRAIIFGGTGFVGSHIADNLAAHGWRVLTTARGTPSPAHPFHPLDLAATSPAELAALLDTHRPDLVVNATGSSWGLTDDQMSTRCLTLTRQLLAALAHSQRTPRLVHLGSVLEYGPTPPGTAVSSQGPPPETGYGTAKLAASQAVIAAPNAVVLRLSNAVGPRLPESSLLGKVATTLIQAAQRHEPAHLSLSRLTAHRDYLDVRDAAEAVRAAATADVSGEIIDIGRGTAVPVRSLVDLLIEVAGIPAVLTEHDNGDWRSTMDWIQVDPSRAAALLHWQPRHTLRDSIRAFWTATAGPSLTALGSNRGGHRERP
ncbi:MULTISPECIES: NAD(P)-dependent oxidoreductase [unclassified Crossiella]|uniref:NAD-dependent epimerase/dehydratase family protein n=1 Tax=unclassified Crossiella TaxID=2620835 RepID=UPI001FFE9968|nr:MULTISPECIES: NAD(P)-dependent oxidoreductase [unclassified Crossiella]MCK2244585.1 NAD(P)-dependent oxidoreductase [Crossiella sp. S99.2]MCK2258216.1 NAD(P)-dependent oxidoreductase [Crossiella sp. S99.1]